MMESPITGKRTRLQRRKTGNKLELHSSIMKSIFNHVCMGVYYCMVILVNNML